MQQPQLNIDLSQTTEETCESCENTTFVQAYKMRKLSALLSPTGQAKYDTYSSVCVCKMWTH